ncbi:dodecin flavoprotein [Candidatus Marinamargulisbacteria bacterium SCGC AG-439-L15]|nr:dodecin flavoprotein [Candidatus Marinamargulisbacteria bacterium SCGC AG-439-L15]
MPNKTYKKVELVGVSDQGISEAVQNAIAKSTETIRHVDWFEVSEIRGYVDKGVPVFQVVVKVGFRLDS